MDVEELLDKPQEAVEAPDIMKHAEAVMSQARTTERQIRTEIRPDGSVTIYKNGEFRLPNGDLYVGETVDERRQGRGTYTFVNGDVYVGEFENGIYHGMGVLRKAPFRETGKDCIGRMYQGQWHKGSRQGKGRYADGFGNVYEGDFHNDAFNGRGSMMYADGRRYEGDWAKGRWHGSGTLVFPIGESYVGGFFRGLFHGEGIYRYGSKEGLYNGSWRFGRKHGIGKRVFASGAEYEGEYSEGAAHGRGLYKSPLGDLYVGNFKDDKFHGDGTLITCTGDRYTGQFQRGIPAGVGRWEYERGGWYEGEFASAARTGVPYRPPPRPAQLVTGMEGEEEEEELPSKGSKASRGSKGSRAGGEKDAKDMVKGKVLAKAAARARFKGKPLIEPEKAKLMSFTAQMQEMEAVRARNGLLSRELEDFCGPILVGSQEDRAYLMSGGKGDTLVVPYPDGKRHGKGVRVWADGSRYEGEWVQDEMHGFGVYVGPGPAGVRYEGSWLGGRRHGRGIQSYGNTDGQSYVCPLGNSHDGAEGRCIYDGEWQEGYFWGEGTLTCCDGRQYSGGYVKGKKHGKGRWVILPASLHYATALDDDGKPILKGAATGENGEPLRFTDKFRVRVHEGIFQHDMRHGPGRAILNNGDILEAEFHEGKPNGQVKMMFATGKVSYATFRHGFRVSWITGPALDAILAAEKRKKEADEVAARRKEKGLHMLVRADAFGDKKRALQAKVDEDRAKAIAKR